MANPEAAAPSAELRLKVLAGAIIALGAILRLWAFLQFRPLWLDEAMLSLNIGARSYGQLLRPLTDDQSAPIPFLWATRLATRIGGVNEVALRALPFVAGLILPVCFWRLSRKLLDPLPAVAATAFLCFSPLLIYYSNEVKPYVIDALFTVLVVKAALDVLADSDSLRRWRRLAIVGAVAVVASAPAFLVLTGVGGALLLASGNWSRPETRRRLVLVGILWVGTFGITYLAFIRPAASNQYLQTYWASSFLSPLEPNLPGRAARAFGLTMQGIFLGEGGSWRARAGLLLLLVCVVGAVHLARRRGAAIAALLTIPLLAAVAASSVHRYPIAPRLMLFASPLLVLLLAAGLQDLSARLPGRLSGRVRSAAMSALVAAVLLLPLRGVLLHLFHPASPEDVRSLAATFAKEHRPGEVIYVFGRSVPSWVFYTTDWKSPDRDRIGRLSELVGSQGPAFRNAPSRGRPVAAEGDDLLYSYGDFRELVGIPAGTGPTLRNPGGANTPDPGWAENEVGRIRRATGDGSAWVLLSSFKPAVGIELVQALRASGANLESRRKTDSAILFRYRFPQ